MKTTEMAVLAAAITVYCCGGCRVCDCCTSVYWVVEVDGCACKVTCCTCCGWVCTAIWGVFTWKSKPDMFKASSPICNIRVDTLGGFSKA